MTHSHGPAQGPLHWHCPCPSLASGWAQTYWRDQSGHGNGSWHHTSTMTYSKCRDRKEPGHPSFPSRVSGTLQKHTQCHLQKHSIWKLPKSLWNPKAYFQFQVNSDKGWMGQSATVSYMPQQHLKQTLSMQAAETQLWVWEAACAAVLSSSLLTFWICPQCTQTWVCPSSSYTSCWGLCSLRAPTDQDPEKGPLRVCSIILGFYLI